MHLLDRLELPYAVGRFQRFFCLLMKVVADFWHSTKIINRIDQSVSSAEELERQYDQPLSPIQA